MITIFAITLVIAAILGISLLRRRHARVDIFAKVIAKNSSLSALLEEQLNKERENSFFSYLLVSFKQTTFAQFDILLFGYTKTRLISYLFIGVMGGVIFNNYYLGLNSYLAIIISFISTVYAILFIKKRALKKHFYDSFPEALAIINGVVSSGSAITTSFKICGDSLEGVVGQTMKDIHMRLEVGENIDNVLYASYRRLAFPEYYFFILTIMVNLDSGGELKEVLSRLAKMLANNRILAKTRDSKTSELRMTVMILACIPFAFILLLKYSSPIHYQYLTETTPGNYILFYVVSSVAIGFLFIRSMINKVV